METKLKKYLDEWGIKQSHVAKKSGISYASISYFVTGTRKPNEKHKKAIAKALDQRIRELF